MENAKIWLLEYEIDGMNGVAVVKAYNANKAQEILLSESQYNAYRNKFKITRIEEIVESPDEMLLMESIE